MIDFRPQSPDDDSHRNDQKSPPDYFSRRVQLRLMVMVFVFMFVLILIEQARDPQLYRWMWRSSKTASQQASPVKRRSSPAIDPPAKLSSSLPDPLEWLPSSQRKDQDYWHTQRDLWENLAAALTSQERLLLNTVLKSSRDKSRLSPESMADWKHLVTKLDADWNRYHAKAYLEIAKFNTDLSDVQKRVWLDVLQRSKDSWEGPLAAAFHALLAEREITPQQQQTLMQIQSTLDQLAFKEIRDHTLFRGSEHTIWFRLFEKLMRTTQEQVQQNSSAHVNFLQLDNQGEEYRGKLVTVTGEIRQGYRVRAPQNILGIREYSVFALKPTDGPEQPIIIYCLETPAGFPTLPDKDVDRQKASLREKASFTGYFFKSWVYKTASSSFSAPLILAKGPAWQSSPVSDTAPSAELTSRQLIMILGGTLLMAVVFTLVVYWRSRWQNAAAVTPSMDQQARNTLSQLPADQVGPGTLDALRELAETSPMTDSAHPDSPAGDDRDP